jgi:hypothetical protein
MTRFLLVLAALAVSGCGAQDTAQMRSEPGAEETVRPPLFQAAYRVDAQIFPEDGSAPLPLVLIRDGARTRMEVSLPNRGDAVFLVRDDETLMIMRLLGGDLVVRAPADAAPPIPEATLAGADLRRMGDCAVAGEAGSLFANPNTGTGQPGRACITADGIMLQAFEGERLVWQANAVRRGAQDPALFEPPLGASIIDAADMGEAAAGMADQFQDPPR